MLQQKQVPRFLGTKTIKQKVPILGTQVPRYLGTRPGWYGKEDNLTVYRARFLSTSKRWLDFQPPKEQNKRWLIQPPRWLDIQPPWTIFLDGVSLVAVHPNSFTKQQQLNKFLKMSIVVLFVQGLLPQKLQNTLVLLNKKNVVQHRIT